MPERYSEPGGPGQQRPPGSSEVMPIRSSKAPPRPPRPAPRPTPTAHHPSSHRTGAVASDAATSPENIKHELRNIFIANFGFTWANYRHQEEILQLICEWAERRFGPQPVQVPAPTQYTQHIITCHRRPCERSVAVPVVDGQLDISTMVGWFYSTDTNWLCPEHAEDV